MASINNHITITTRLQMANAPLASYNQLFLVDHADIPIDRRFRDISKDEIEDLTADGAPEGFATAFWSQALECETLRLGRWISAASSPHFICGMTESTFDIDLWTPITAGALRIRDNTGTPLVDTLSSLNFSSCTDADDVLLVLNTALGALSPHNIVGIEAGEFAFDALGRLVLTNSTTGASAKTIEIYAPASGTDITTASLLNVAAGHIIPGYDAEEPTAALTAISAKNGGGEYYDVAIRGEDASQQLDLATYIEARKKQLTLVTGDANCKDASDTTNIGYLVKALGYNRTTILYTEHDITATGGWIDAAINGAVYPAQEGSLDWGWTDVAGVYESGKGVDDEPIALTSAERAGLETHGILHFETVGNTTYSYSGLNVGGIEKRIMFGADWLDDSIAADIFAYNINAAIPAFDNKTLGAYEGIIRQRLKEAKDRGIIVDTDVRPIVVTIPDEDEFTSAQRATHELEILDAWSAYLNSSAYEVSLSGALVQ